MKLRRVTVDDAAFLFRLLKQRPDTHNISHRKMPSRAKHLAFIRSLPYAHWYVLHDNGIDIGSIYLSRQDEIGVNLLFEHRSTLMTQRVMLLLMAKHKRKRYLANAAPQNTALQYSLTGIAFSLIQHTYELRP